MIGWLSGELRFRLPNGNVVVDTGGVGYEVAVTDDASIAVGDVVELFVYTVVRDDAIILYGFRDLDERSLFELLLATPGVGPATAIGALRTMRVDRLVAAIEGGDVKTISTISGIGPKTASRIVLELKGRLVSPPSETGSPVASAIDGALRQLGYTASEVRDALRDLELPEREDEALRVALAQLRRP